MTTPPPTYLPGEVDYDQVVTAIAALLPDVRMTDIAKITIEPRTITVDVINNARTIKHEMHITHVQGAYTEGGGHTPDTTPTGAGEEQQT